MAEGPQDILICLLTFRRTDLALRTVRSCIENLSYAGRLRWYVADDGSGEDHLRPILEALHSSGADVVGYHSERLGPGPSWNRAVQAAAVQASQIMWLEDDWELRRPLDLTPYGVLLNERTDVGMVRLGHLPINLLCETVGYDGRHYLNVLKDRQYCYSGNPSLRHYRHFMAYGGYPTDKRTPGECEVYHDHLVRTREGPMVWWPVDLGGWGIFGHTGTDKSY